ncbi:MAG: glycosyltransferase family 2 protein, partial [Bryobacterales bacterium]|nr:glycosyltransferase family 2 protein [Bryobacterales bacterium]
MMSPAPAVSIIIPAFNAAPWLKDAVHSVLAQSYRDWELIVVNDGSTDGTSALAKSFNDPRIRVIDQTNAGVSAARNAGMAAAQGNLFAFLDADDAMLPETLNRKVGTLRNSGVDWVFGDMALCNP